jgi:recombination protein RecA
MKYGKVEQMSKLDQLVAKINKEWNEDIAARGIHRIDTNKIPFTSPRLNYMTYGGLPRNRLIEFAGEEGGGKTTTALDVCKNAQTLFREEFEAELSNTQDLKRKAYLESRGEKKIVYADCENTLDEDWAVKLGVDVDNMYIIKPQTQVAEDIFQMLLDMMETDEVGLVIIDSIGVMLSKQAFEKEVGEKTYGGISMALTRFAERAVLICRKYDCTVIGINQMRDDLNSPYGGKTTTGGRAWKHNCSARLQFAKGDYIDEKGNKLNRNCDTPAGNKVLVSIVKTKVDKPDRKTGFYTLTYDFGIDEVADLIEVGMKYGIVNKSGAWFSLVDIETGEIISDESGKDLKFQGQSTLAEYLRNDEVLLNELRRQISKAMGAGT